MVARDEGRSHDGRVPLATQPQHPFLVNQNLPIPPCGWNSFDSFGGYLHEGAAFAQLEAQASRLASSGYDIFVVDIGWFGEYELKSGSLLPAPKTKHALAVNLDAFGRPQPSRCYFPNGFAALIARTHELGLKFGVHVMRGIPRQAVAQALPILGAPAGVTAADIADRSSVCPWCHYNYGIDMARPGAQAYYDSLVAQLAEWGVDFIKADDITGYPLEIEAFVRAIGKCGRKITLSLSHGGEADPALMPVYRQSDMVRVTKDIWDDPESIERSFLAWEYWQGHTRPGFWPDLDMIPFGDLQTMSPEPAPGELPEGSNPSLCGRGFRRRCLLGLEERQTFITQRALAASPLFMGGDLVTLTDEDLRLLTDPEMLACNRRGEGASVCYLRGDVQVWHAPDRTQLGRGWLGVFNRNPARKWEAVVLAPDRLRLPGGTRLHDVWRRRELGTLADRPQLVLPPLGCCFIAYRDGRAEARVAPPETFADRPAAE